MDWGHFEELQKMEAGKQTEELCETLLETLQNPPLILEVSPEIAALESALQVAVDAEEYLKAAEIKEALREARESTGLESSDWATWTKQLNRANKKFQSPTKASLYWPRSSNPLLPTLTQLFPRSRRRCQAPSIRES